MSALTWRTDGGRVLVEHQDAALLDLCAQVGLADGRVVRTDGDRASNLSLDWFVQRGGDPPSPVILNGSFTPFRMTGEAAPVHVRPPGFAAQPGLEGVPGGLIVRLRIRNGSAEPVRVAWMAPLVAERGVQAVTLRQLRISQTGWQSWSRATPPVPFAPNAESSPPPIRTPILPDRLPDSQVSPWMAVLRADNQPDLLVGWLTATARTGLVEVAPTAEGGYVVRAWQDAEGARLAPGETLDAEPLLLLAGPEEELLAVYADAAGAAMGARPLAPETPTGWCSWYELFTHVTEQDVLKNLQALARHRADLPVRLLQIDDGYQREVGDWLDLRPESFPRGLRPLAESAREAGLQPGLWIAPFLLSGRSRTYAEHPDWVVREPSTDEPIVAIENWGCANYGLDTTNPDALAWIRGVVRTAVHEWGFPFLKLDFVYAAALRGQRFDTTLTSVQAYRLGMLAIREAAGDGTFLLGCGAPLLPSVGIVDAMRIGSDVAPYWQADAETTRTPGVGPSTTNALRATSVRGWLHRRWWLNDPDCVLARRERSRLTEDEVRAWASVVALSGGLTMLGDDLSRLDAERLALLGRLLPPHGGSAPRAYGPYIDDIPSQQVLHAVRNGAEWWVAGLGNWAATASECLLGPAALGLPARPIHLFDLWGATYLGTCAVGERKVLGMLPPHAMRLLLIRVCDGSRPVVVGSTGHLLGPVQDVLAERWDASTGTLHVQLAERAARGAGDVAIHAGGWRVTPVQGGGAPPVAAAVILNEVKDPYEFQVPRSTFHVRDGSFAPLKDDRHQPPAHVRPPVPGAVDRRDGDLLWVPFASARDGLIERHFMAAPDADARMEGAGDNSSGA